MTNQIYHCQTANHYVILISISSSLLYNGLYIVFKYKVCIPFIYFALCGIIFLFPLQTWVQCFNVSEIKSITQILNLFVKIRTIWIFRKLSFKACSLSLLISFANFKLVRNNFQFSIFKTNLKFKWPLHFRTLQQHWGRDLSRHKFISPR